MNAQVFKKVFDVIKIESSEDKKMKLVSMIKMNLVMKYEIMYFYLVTQICIIMAYGLWY